MAPDAAMDSYEVGAKIGPAEFTRRMHTLVPVSGDMGIVAERMDTDGSAAVRLAFQPTMLRPGGTISGPALMTMADVAMFAGVNGRLGWTPMALTANLNTTFLRPPKPEDLVAEATPLRFGRRLAFFAVTIASVSDLDRPVAHVTGSYALPDTR